MKETLKRLQAMQEMAFEKGVHSFEITARYYDDGEQGFTVAVFLTGDDSENDYNHWFIYERTNPKYILMDIADFVGLEMEEE